MFLRALGIPSGWDSLRTGFGAFLTPGIGRSLALEKVAQFGAQWAIVEKLKV